MGDLIQVIAGFGHRTGEPIECVCTPDLFFARELDLFAIINIPDNCNCAIYISILIPEKLRRHRNPDAFFLPGFTQDHLLRFGHVLASQRAPERQLLLGKRNHAIIQVETEVLRPILEFKLWIGLTEQGLCGLVQVLDVTFPVHRDNRKWDRIKNFLRSYCLPIPRHGLIFRCRSFLLSRFSGLRHNQFLYRPHIFLAIQSWSKSILNVPGSFRYLNCEDE